MGEFGLFTMTVTYVVFLLAPLVAAFYFSLALLEDSGFLPRIATLVDRALSAIAAGVASLMRAVVAANEVAPLFAAATEQGESRGPALVASSSPAEEQGILVHARDDKAVPFANSVALADAARAAGVPCELRLYNVGGHGFGTGVREGDSKQWVDECLRWMKERNVLAVP